jgi:hypothetical protein
MAIGLCASHFGYLPGKRSISGRSNDMPRNISYRRPIEAIRTARTKPVVTKRTGTLGVRAKVPKRKSTG